MASEKISLELDLNQFTASAREGTAALQTMAVVADQNVVPALNAVDKSADQLAATKKRLGMALMDVNYIVQDFTSQIGTRGMLGGLNAIQNNIPNLIRDLGGASGLGGTIGLVSIAAVGAAQAVGAIGASGKEAAAAAKELADQTERLAKLKTPGEEKSKDDVESFIKQSGGGAILQGIRSSLERRARPQAARMVQESIAQFGVVQETEDQIMARWSGQIQQDAQRAFTGMASNQVDMGFVAALAQENPGAFPKGFAGDLASFSPAAIKAADAEEKRVAEFGDRASRGAASRRRRASERQEGFELTRQGGIFENMDAAARRMRVEQALDSRTESDIQRMDAGEEKIGDSKRMAREFDKALATARRDVARDRNSVGRDIAGGRTEIGRIVEQIGKLYEMENRGLATHEQTMSRVHDLQAMESQIDQRLRQLEQRERQLQQRQTILNRGR
jgi:hypothetical protein